MTLEKSAQKFVLLAEIKNSWNSGKVHLSFAFLKQHII